MNDYPNVGSNKAKYGYIYRRLTMNLNRRHFMTRSLGSLAVLPFVNLLLLNKEQVVDTNRFIRCRSTSLRMIANGYDDEVYFNRFHCDTLEAFSEHKEEINRRISRIEILDDNHKQEDWAIFCDDYMVGTWFLHAHQRYGLIKIHFKQKEA